MARKDDDENNSSGGAALGGSTVWWGAGGLIVLVLLGLVWILISGNGSGSTATPTQTVTVGPSGQNSPSSLPASSRSAATGTAAGCQVPGGSNTIPVLAPAVTWQGVGAVAAPVSSTLGPLSVSGTDHENRACFQHSPGGAVIAAINTSVASISPEGASVVRSRWTAGAGKNEIMVGDGGAAGAATVAGFQVQSCDQSSCLISVAYTSAGQTGAITMPMVWVGSDWKVNGQLTGLSSATPIANLNSYVLMSPGGAS